MYFPMVMLLESLGQDLNPDCLISGSALPPWWRGEWTYLWKNFHWNMLYSPLFEMVLELGLGSNTVFLQPKGFTVSLAQPWKLLLVLGGFPTDTFWSFWIKFDWSIFQDPSLKCITEFRPVFLSQQT